MGDFVTKIAELNITLPSNEATLLAATMMRNALEAESKYEKDLAVQEAESKKDLAVQAKDFEIACIQAQRRSDLSALSQRCVCVRTVMLVFLRKR